MKMRIEFGKAHAPCAAQRRCLRGRAARVGGADAGTGKLVSGQFQTRGLGKAERGRVHGDLESGTVSGALNAHARSGSTASDVFE
jgi:hypothetical protein